MRELDKIRLRLRSLFRRCGVDRELEDEFRFHLDHLVEEEIAAGAAPEEARRSALRKMGGITQFQEESRDMRRVNYIDDLLRDVRYAARNLRRQYLRRSCPPQKREQETKVSSTGHGLLDLNNPAPYRNGHSLGAVRSAKFFHNVSDVHLDGLFGDPQ